MPIEIDRDKYYKNQKTKKKNLYILDGEREEGESSFFPPFFPVSKCLVPKWSQGVKLGPGWFATVQNIPRSFLAMIDNAIKL